MIINYQYQSVSHARNAERLLSSARDCQASALLTEGPVAKPHQRRPRLLSPWILRIQHFYQLSVVGMVEIYVTLDTTMVYSTH